MNIVRGSTAKIKSIVYLDKDNNVLADLTGASIRAMLKADARDADGIALVTKNTGGSGIVVISPAQNGECETTFTAAELNVITQNKLYFEIVVKLADGSYIRSGIEDFNLKGNVIKTLF